MTSLERRTASNMTEFTEFDRLANICRLEIGCMNFGNMLQDSDLVTLFTRMVKGKLLVSKFLKSKDKRFLTSLKLVFCHLISMEAPLLCEKLPGADRLQVGVQLLLFVLIFIAGTCGQSNALQSHPRLCGLSKFEGAEIDWH